MSIAVGQSMVTLRSWAHRGHGHVLAWDLNGAAIQLHADHHAVLRQLVTAQVRRAIAQWTVAVQTVLPPAAHAHPA